MSVLFVVRIILSAIATNFLGSSPLWYKKMIIGFLVFNAVWWILAPLWLPEARFIAGWILLLEFIFTLAMALRCYPLQPGGLLAVEAVILNMTSPESIFREIETNLSVILLLIFMVAGIYFLRDVLMWGFTQLILRTRSKIKLSFLFITVSAILSAFLDALTVTAVLITISMGIYRIFYEVAAAIPFQLHGLNWESQVLDHQREHMEQFCCFLRNILMHSVIGTALGGVCTLVGEPQNVLIAEKAGWDFMEFIIHMAPITVPVFIIGLATCLLLEKFKIFGFGVELPQIVRHAIEDNERLHQQSHQPTQWVQIAAQGVVAILLVFMLIFHVAPLGLIGLTVIVLATALTGVVEEHRMGNAFSEALPFTALLAVFFAIVAVIHDLHLFDSFIQYVLHMNQEFQPIVFFALNGLLSIISDNVFVATVYMTQLEEAFHQQVISRELYERLAVAINTGTNIPSIATPNGQAALLFLLTSQIALLIKLSYARMVWMALPYTLTCVPTAMLAIILFL